MFPHHTFEYLIGFGALFVFKIINEWFYRRLNYRFLECPKVLTSFMLFGLKTSSSTINYHLIAPPTQITIELLHLNMQCAIEWNFHFIRLIFFIGLSLPPIKPSLVSIVTTFYMQYGIVERHVCVCAKKMQRLVKEKERCNDGVYSVTNV